MGPRALSSLLLLLSLATGDADMKGHFDPGEETGSWVPEGWGLGDRESEAVTPHVPVFTQPSAAMPWACRTGPSRMGTSLPLVPGQTPRLLVTAGTWHTGRGCPGG